PGAKVAGRARTRASSRAAASGSLPPAAPPQRPVAPRESVVAKIGTYVRQPIPACMAFLPLPLRAPRRGRGEGEGTARLALPHHPRESKAGLWILSTPAIRSRSTLLESQSFDFESRISSISNLKFEISDVSDCKFAPPTLVFSSVRRASAPLS